MGYIWYEFLQLSLSQLPLYLVISVLHKTWMYAVLPLLGGALGSLVSVFWFEITKKTNLPKNVIFKYLFLGCISGFVAVCLLNPDGNFSAKAALAIIFGLSPMSFLKGQSFFDGKEEGSALDNYMDNVDAYANSMKEKMDLEELNKEDVDAKELVKLLKSQYNKGKGDDYNA